MIDEKLRCFYLRYNIIFCTCSISPYIILYPLQLLNGRWSCHLWFKRSENFCNLVDVCDFYQAYESLSDGLGKTASALIHTPMKTYQRGGGAGSAFVSAVRGAPAAAIAPASAAAQALRCALLGVRNRSLYQS